MCEFGVSIYYTQNMPVYQCVFWAHRLVEMVSHRVRKCSYGIIKDEQVLVLILPKSKNQRVQDEAQIRHQLCTRLLLQGGKCTLEKIRWVRRIYERKVRQER